jgi:aryl-alcohol dehydrogenase-like predicted oxidoreductase
VKIMQTTTLPQTSISTSRLGLGCAGLMRLTSRHKRQELLAAALDAGVSHFDVARMYGLGVAEGELGRFARGRRDRLTIATKFGIEAAPPRWLARLQRPARALIARYPRLRGAARRREAAFHEPRAYDARSARKSLETSLRELGTEYVDILLVHDPHEGDDIAVEELRDFLESAREAGTIRSWGVAGETATAIAAARSLTDDAVVQVRDDILSRREPSARPEPTPQITFGVLSSALGQILAHVRSSDSVRDRWNAATGLDCTSTDVVASLLIRDGLATNPGGTLLVGTTRADRIGAAAALDPEPTPELRAFQGLVAVELTGRPEGVAA